jgi:hypothetical protein
MARVTWRAVLALAALGSPALCAAPAFRNVGFYHWGGRRTASMSEGVERIARLGGRVARVVLSPRYYRDYHISQSCYAGYSLTAIANEPDVKRALDNESIDVFILTAYDGATLGDCEHTRFLNPPFYTPENTRALMQEYSDFTLYLYRTYRHTHKRFIVSDWEGDNNIYCQAAYAYAVSPQFRAYCDTNYAAFYGNRSPAESLKGLKLWHQARQRGIADGRNRAAAEGIGGMRVCFAPEFSITRALHDAGLPSVLYDILPGVMFDYVSYSAYESINQPDPGARLAADLETIQSVTGSSAIIIGEAGFARSVWGAETITRTDQVIAAALAWGDLDGNATPLAEYFAEKFAAQ